METIITLTIKKLSFPPLKLKSSDEKSVLAWIEVYKDECRFIILPLEDDNKNSEIKVLDLLNTNISNINEIANLENKIVFHNFSTLWLYFSNHSELIAHRLYYDTLLRFSSIFSIMEFFLEKLQKCKEIKNSFILALFHESLLIGLKRLLQNIVEIKIEDVKYNIKNFNEREIIISVKWKIIGKKEHIKEELTLSEKIFDLCDSIFKKGKNEYYEEDGYIMKILLSKNFEQIYSKQEKYFLIFYLLLDPLERQKFKWYIMSLKKIYLKYKSIEFIKLQRELIREM